MRVVTAQVVKHDLDLRFVREDPKFEIALIVRRASEFSCHVAVILDGVSEIFSEKRFLAKVAVLLLQRFHLLFLGQFFQAQVAPNFFAVPKAFFVSLCKVHEFCGFANRRLLLLKSLGSQFSFRRNLRN